MSDEHESTSVNDSFENEELNEKRNSILIIIISGVLLALGLYLELLAGQHLIAQFIFLIVTLIAGHDIIRSGVYSLLKLRLDMSFLMSLAAAGAFIIGHGEEGAAVMFLFFIAEFLEDYASERARKSVAALMKLAPETALVIRDGREETLHVHEIKKGDVLVIKPGDRIPLDGLIIKGASSINQASLTGESMPVPKIINDSVFAGTINIDGYLEVKVTKESKDTFLSRIIKLVDNAQKKKSRTESFIDKFTAYYTPIVIVLAVSVMIVPVVFFNGQFNEWFYKSLVLLVTSCPCALAISTPVSMVSAITSGARNGVLIKGGKFIESIRKARVIVFDKTGTLTEGKPEVVDVTPLNGYSGNDLLSIAASLDYNSKHPLARAIVKKALSNKVSLSKVNDYVYYSGKGSKGRIDNKVFYTGNKELFIKNKIKMPLELIRKLESEGKTLVIVGNSDHLLGIISFEDKIRTTAFNVIKQVKKMNIKTVMLTGDNEDSARIASGKLGLDEYYAGLSPVDKVDIINKLSRKYGNVIMVGDGINDAPALAKASIGIVMGETGSDAAIETADIALINNDLTRITYLIKLSGRTMNVVKQNVSLSLIIKTSFAILAFPGIITLWIAVAVGDMGLSLGVILNALRIGRIK